MPFTRFLQVVENCDKFPYRLDDSVDSELSGIRPIVLYGQVIGHVQPRVLPALVAYNDAQPSPPPFIITSDNIQFNTWVDTFEKRTKVVKQLMDTWRDAKVMKALAGWRDELYPVYGNPYHPENVAFVMERAATPLFGIPTFGVHVNGFVRKRNGIIHLWVARRALTKPTWPGVLDNCVAGGISYQYSTKETVIKECDEEASIPAEIAEKAQNAGAISYYTYTDNGLQPETQYVFDLEMPSNFTPTPKDGEVESFLLWPVDKVKESILNGEWKPNCALVTIDFMIRHGIITADNEPDYIEIICRLHRKLEFPNPRRVN